MSNRSILQDVFIVVVLLALSIVSIASADVLVSQGLDSGAYSSSGDVDPYVKTNAFDGVLSTAWVGNGATGWIEVDLGRTVDVSKVEVVVAGAEGRRIIDVCASDAPIGDFGGYQILYTFDQSCTEGYTLTTPVMLPVRTSAIYRFINHFLRSVTMRHSWK